MFSGIIEKLGAVTQIENLGGPEANLGLQLQIQTGLELALGESLAVNGVCLTVAQIINDGEQSFFVSSETLNKTNLKNLSRHVNLERALRLEDRISGHWVQGHVESTAVISRIEPVGEDWNLFVRLSNQLAKYCIEKGSICVDGVSLTVNSLTVLSTGETEVQIRLVPYTLQHTRFQFSKVGDFVNVETDIIAKYVERLMHASN